MRVHLGTIICNFCTAREPDFALEIKLTIVSLQRCDTGAASDIESRSGGAPACPAISSQVTDIRLFVLKDIALTVYAFALLD